MGSGGQQPKGSNSLSLSTSLKPSDSLLQIIKLFVVAAQRATLRDPPPFPFGRPGPLDYYGFFRRLWIAKQRAPKPSSLESIIYFFSGVKFSRVEFLKALKFFFQENSEKIIPLNIGSCKEEEEAKFGNDSSVSTSLLNKSNPIPHFRGKTCTIPFTRK